MRLPSVAPRQGVGDDRLDGLLAMRAPVAMNGVLGDDRSDLLGNVLGDPSACLIGPGQRSVTLGTGFEAMIDASIRFGRGPPRTGVSGLATGTFATAIGLGFEIGRDHCRGSRRRDDRWRRALWLGK